ncbi:MAG TPA: chemotaxis protein CheW [Pseudomonadota bacterium]|jgi:chemotaxis signal transduction protein|nr:chemotaxis protein CheW [Pseudomonadota bacterium]HND10370.1 chemotaxis protein CheW [Pseudomonadota bacterium]HNF98260.1 chemotaxis protein CheW [Pseudomonadota bacterium]HNI61375.1 chemotaxis protein CheW [Pseudomonadota bacterium]HNK46827.1 chemotaxis protein CheW [Pseudomonadota bacterium]
MKHGTLIISCAQALLALPVQHIVEVSRMVAPCARLLRVPKFVLGIVDFHGQLVPVLDLPARLGLCPARSVLDLALGHIVFIELPGGIWGLAVDNVQDLIELPTEPIAFEPRHLAGLLLGSIKLPSHERALVLNPVKLLSVVTRAKVASELRELLGGEA